MDFNYNKYQSQIFTELNGSDFDKLAFQAFEYQYKNNQIYREYCDLLKKNTVNVQSLADIPFIPIEFFKSHKIISGTFQYETIFTSSTTTGSTPSKHFIKDTSIYISSFINGFRKFYGDPSEYCILGLLPSYLERSGSSLVFMVDELIKLSKNKLSGFFLNDFDSLNDRILQLESNGEKYLLIGVSFGLLDFGEKYQPEIKNGIIMETGGMKGRRKEMVREELHEMLKGIFSVHEIHSEYGMTELFSQSYSHGEGIFKSPPWMKILTREIEDPFKIRKTGSGGINVIDLANINSCCFIATSDLGEVYDSNTFSISGRFDNSDTRGCNLMVL